MSVLKKAISIKMEKKVAIVMFLWGLVMMFMIPTWQIPDEHTHLTLIANAINNEDFANILTENTSIPRGVLENNYDSKVDKQAFFEGMTQLSDYEKAALMPNGLSPYIIKYLPCFIGIFAGILLGLPVYWVLQLGELMSLACGVAICYLALKIMPVKKELFAMILMIPMVLQQIGGITYDAVLIPLCFLWIAYLFYLKFKADEIGIKEAVAAAVIWLLITYLKLPYCFFILLVFILPLEKLHLRIGSKWEINQAWVKKYGIFVCAAGLVFVLAALYGMRDNKWIQLVIGLIQEWRQTLHLLKETGVTWHKMLITSSVGNFGWLDTPISYKVALLTYVLIFAVALFNSENKEETMLRHWDRLVIWGTVIILCLFTTFAMVNHTIMVVLYGSEYLSATYDINTALYQIPYIGGVQGRYYLPFVSLFFLPLPQLMRVGKKKVWGIISVFEAAMFVYVIYILFYRYWMG